MIFFVKMYVEVYDVFKKIDSDRNGKLDIMEFLE